VTGDVLFEPWLSGVFKMSSVEQLITLVPDATPPYVTGVTPSANSIAEAKACPLAVNIC